jgi:high-affinity iron transporter
MTAFPGLSEHERWSLAFYVGQLGAPANLLNEGQQVWNEMGETSPLASLESITTVSPAEARAAHGLEGAALLTHLRQHPQPLFEQKSSPLAFARASLIEAGAAYERGDRQQAYDLAVTAYLEGFELAEAGLNAADPALRERIERQMTGFRGLVRNGAPVETVIGERDQILVALDEAEGQMTGSLSPAAAFAGAFVILLREGLEAILVLAAFVAFLTKTGRRDGMPYLHAGWVGALAAGALTWYVSSYIIQIGGAGRELTEGAAALFAAAVLFGIGFWMHDKSHAAQWQRFIEERMGKALGAASLWSLALLVFVVVYREIFETILFYQALWIQSTPAGHGMIGAGFGAAVAALAVLAWLVLKYSQRLPLRQFFGVTGAFLLVLAVVFAGKGIAAFQEAGKLPATPLDMPTIDLLGIYPNMEGLAVQVAMVIGALAMLLVARRRSVGGESAA